MVTTLSIVDGALIQKILFGVFTLITGLILLYFQKSLEQDRKVETKDNNRVKFELERAELTKQINDNILSTYNCDRSAIWVIHNGQVVANNIHLYKMTMMWESISQGIPKIAEVCKDFKIMDYMSLWKPLLTGQTEKVIIKASDFVGSDKSELAKMIRSHGVQSSINVLITDIYGSPIALLSLSWVKEIMDVDSVDTKKLLEYSHKLSGILSQKFNENNK